MEVQEKNASVNRHNRQEINSAKLSAGIFIEDNAGSNGYWKKLRSQIKCAMVVIRSSYDNSCCCCIAFTLTKVIGCSRAVLPYLADIHDKLINIHIQLRKKY